MKRKTLIPKYARGGKLLPGLRDAGRSLVDSFLTPLEAIGGDFYDPEYETKLGQQNAAKGMKMADKVAGALLPTAASIIGTSLGGPQVGQLAGATTGILQSQIGSQVTTPEERRMQSRTQVQPGMEDFQQPSSIYDNDPYNYFAEGGLTSKPNYIEVEGNELETTNGKITRDFRNLPKHKDGGFTYDANSDRVIIPARLRKRYLEGDKRTRNTIEANVINDQIDREDRFATYAKGGLTRSEDYGLKSKPYPSVKASDFAGQNRSYPIPTKDDAVDALRLAGLHGRSDIKSKVYKRYPELRKAEKGLYTTPPPDESLIPYAEGFAPYDISGWDSSITPNPPEQPMSGMSYDWGKPQLDMTVPQTKPNWKQGVYGAVQAAPILYNLYQGTQEPQVLQQSQYQNPYESDIRSLYRNRQINMKPIEDAISDSYRAGLHNIASGQKSSGAVLSGATSLWGSRMNALAKARLEAQQASNTLRGEEAAALSGLGSQYAQRKLAIQDINDRNAAARRSFLAKSTEGLSQYAQGSNRDEIYYGLLEDMFRNYKYDPNTRRYIFKS